MPVFLDSSSISPIFVGRAVDLQALEYLVDQSLQKSGRVAVVSGDAGIGKSRLVKELAARATDRGFSTLQGSCFELDRALPYAPLADLFRSLPESQRGESMSKHLGPNARDLVKLLPEITNAIPSLDALPPLSPELEKRRLFDAMKQLLNRLSTEQPLLIVLEDLHWSDDSTLEFLQYLAHSLIGRSMLLVLTIRTEQARPSLIHFMAELARERRAIQVDLQPLSRTDVQTMLRAIFHLDHPLRTDLVDTVYKITEGNPFFIEEISKSLIQDGDSAYKVNSWDQVSIGQLQIPLTIQDAVLGRLAGLSEPAQHLLILASVAGRRFDFSLLQGLTELNEEQLLTLLKELVAAQLMVEESADRFAFRHALTREATYASLLLRERKRYHRLIGETIRRLYANDLAHVADLAYHFFQAEEWTATLEYSRRAGEQAQRLYAPREAQEQFSRALEAGRHLASPLPAGLYRARGQASEMLGEFERAKTDYDQALAQAREVDDRTAEWQSLVDLGFLWASRDYDQTGQYFQQALGLARKIGDPDLVARSLNRIGNWHVNVGQPAEGLRLHQEALDTFQELGHQSGIAESLDLMGMASYLNSNLILGVTYYKQAVSLFQELSNRQGLTSSLALLSQRAGSLNFDTVVTSGDRLRDAVRDGDQALTIAREIGYRSGEAFSLVMLAMVWGTEGDYGRALDNAQLGLEIAEEINHYQWQSAAHAALGAIELELFALGTARTHLERALDLARQSRTEYWIANASRFLARCYTLQGDPWAAEALIAAAAKPGLRPQTQAQRLLWAAKIELTLANGEPQHALDLVIELITFLPGRGEETIAAVTSVIPYLWYLRGQALLELQNTPEAADVLTKAREAAAQRGARSLLWRIHVALGKAMERQGRQKQARAEFAAASRLIEELAATIPGGGFREDLMQGATAFIPGLRSTARLRKRTFTDLTPREREVVGWIAKGKSNSDIAQFLTVSERTVESHVSNILSKLGFSSRSQIAIWAKDKQVSKR